MFAHDAQELVIGVHHRHGTESHDHDRGDDVTFRREMSRLHHFLHRLLDHHQVKILLCSCPGLRRRLFHRHISPPHFRSCMIVEQNRKSLYWFNQTNETNQTDQMNQTDWCQSPQSSLRRCCKTPQSLIEICRPFSQTTRILTRFTSSPSEATGTCNADLIPGVPNWLPALTVMVEGVCHANSLCRGWV